MSAFVAVENNKPFEGKMARRAMILKAQMRKWPS
jgi:hypothetical protein